MRKTPSRRARVDVCYGALGGGPTGRPADDVATFTVWLCVTAAIMLCACLAACIEPARRALRIQPSDALREA